MTKNKSLDIISETISYVEKNIREPLTLDLISQNAHISKYHLDRIFRAITNRNLMDYIRGRKLSHSVFTLLNTDMKVIDIAMEYGFQYEQSYIRSFKKTFKQSPNKVRRENISLEMIEKINIDRLNAAGEYGVILEPRILLKPEFEIAGIRHKIYSHEDEEYEIANSLGNDFYNNHRHRIKNTINPNVYTALIKLPTDTPHYAYYIPSVEISNTKGIPSDMEINKIPTQIYAIFTYIGLHHPSLTTINSLKDIHFYIFANWLHKSSYTMAADYFFERIDEDIARDDYCEVELFIPIKHK